MDQYALRSKGDLPLVVEEDLTDRQTTNQTERQTTANLPATNFVPIPPDVERSFMALHPGLASPDLTTAAASHLIVDSAQDLYPDLTTHALTSGPQGEGSGPLSPVTTTAGSLPAGTIAPDLTGMTFQPSSLEN